MILSPYIEAEEVRDLMILKWVEVVIEAVDISMMILTSKEE